MNAISASELRKAYGGHQAVDGISFVVDEGQVCCILGPNGAGKTTTVEMLEGYRRADSGEVRVLGFEPAAAAREFRARIGIVPQQSQLPYGGTVLQVLEAYRRYYPRSRSVDELLRLAELEHAVDRPVRVLSGGEARRMEFALALVGWPEVLFLDEPTTGFDAAARRRAWDTVDTLARDGVTIVLTTHFMEEAQRLADHVVVVVDGSVLAEGSPDELAARGTAPTTIRYLVPDGVPRPPFGDPDDRGGRGAMRLKTTEPMRAIHELTGWAVDHDVSLEQISVAPPSLEDVYLVLTGELHDHSGEVAR